MPDMDKAAFGRALARLRRAAGLTQRQLAAQLTEQLGTEVPAQSVHAWEHADRYWLPDNRAAVEALAVILGDEDLELLGSAGYVAGPSMGERLTQLEERFDRMEAQLAEILRRLPRRGSGGSR